MDKLVNIKLRDLRTQHGLTIREMAQLAQITPDNPRQAIVDMQRWDSGLRSLPIWAAQRIAYVFDVDWRQLYPDYLQGIPENYMPVKIANKL